MYSADASDVEVEQRFQVEIDAEKRRWLRAMFPEAVHQFFNVSRLGGALSLDAKKTPPSLSPLDQVHIFFCGFSCKSVSQINPQSQGGRYEECATDWSGETGSTLRGCLNYVRRHHPLCVILENVAGFTFGGKNLTTLKETLQSYSYHVVDYVSSPHELIA